MRSKLFSFVLFVLISTSSTYARSMSYDFLQVTRLEYKGFASKKIKPTLSKFDDSYMFKRNNEVVYFDVRYADYFYLLYPNYEHTNLQNFVDLAFELGFSQYFTYPRKKTESLKYSKDNKCVMQFLNNYIRIICMYNRSPTEDYVREQASKIGRLPW